MKSRDSASSDTTIVTPPRFFDPRRLGTLIGLVGSCTFVFGYVDELGALLALGAKVVVGVLVTGSIFMLFVKPRWLGVFTPAKGWAIGVYLVCVGGELALIAVGSMWLTRSGLIYLRPALIATVVGLHFIPFAWAFGERMFYFLGGALILLGGVGLIVRTEQIARASAVVSGLAMATLVLAYALGVFARPAPSAAVAHAGSTN